MPNVSFAQPDVTLLLDLEGVIRKATLSSAVVDETFDEWLGRPWIETVASAGGRSVQHMVEDARRTGVSGFRQVAQRFPSGRELPMEYTTVRLGGTEGLLAVGKNLQAVAKLQSRLISAQQAMERDYWKLREVDTRDRLLFDPADDAALVVRASDLQVVDANPAAIRAIGTGPVGQGLLTQLAAADCEPVRGMLARVREHGKAPGLLIRLGPDAKPWLVRASQMANRSGAVLLLQLAPAASTSALAERCRSVPVEALVERMPDGFIVLDPDGLIAHANRAFLDLVQVAAKAAVVGERLHRWLGRPGADVGVLLSSIQRLGTARLFSTTLHGALGSETEVELSATGSSDGRPEFIGVIVRDVGNRLRMDWHATSDGIGPVLGTLSSKVGKTPLLELVRDTVGAVERHHVSAALKLTRGNRTAAAELLGLSRQSLYAKLRRYGLDGGGEAASD